MKKFDVEYWSESQDEWVHDVTFENYDNALEYAESEARIYPKVACRIVEEVWIHDA